MDRILTQDQKNNIIAQKISTPEGRARLGQTMLEPFKLGRDYVSIGRKLMAVDVLGTGAPMWYDKDPQFTSVTLAQDGMIPYEIVKGDRVYYEPFLIAQLVRIPALEVAVRRFNILDREQKKGRIEMSKEEDRRIFSALAVASESATNHNTVVTSAAGTTRATLADLLATLEQHNAPTVTLLMNPAQYRDIRCWNRNDIDPVTMYELRKTGYVGDLWGANIRTSFLVPAGKIFAITEPQLFGVISVRVDLQQWDSPDQTKLHYGWIFFEYIAVIAVIAQGAAEAAITGKVT